MDDLLVVMGVRTFVFCKIIYNRPTGWRLKPGTSANVPRTVVQLGALARLRLVHHLEDLGVLEQRVTS